MGHKKNGKKVRIAPHESVDSQESMELDEFSDEDDEVFVRHDRLDSEEAGRPLIKRRKKRKQNGELRTEFRKGHDKYRRCCGPICWTFLIFKTLVGKLFLNSEQEIELECNKITPMCASKYATKRTQSARKVYPNSARKCTQCLLARV